MPRLRRPVFIGLPHHVTQRGNHRERVFFESGDEQAYLALLHAYTAQQGVAVTAYCLMPNHVHLVMTPSSANGMHLALRAVHSQYAQRVNRMRIQKGHLWQGRYFSSALDANYLLNAVRYVELNPVRAGMVAKAEDYDWSSAPARCGLRYDPIIKPLIHPHVLGGIADWSSWLAESVSVETMEALRQNSGRNLPCGSPEFVSELEGLAGRDLRFRKRGGQPKAEPQEI